MGCGQSQFSLIYPKKFKRKENKNKDGKEDESDEENDEDKAIGGRLISNKSIPNLVAAADKEDSNLDNSKLPNNSSNEVSSSTSLLAHREMTSSQLEFFKMLDEKIESGADYNETKEEVSLEEARREQLKREWNRVAERHKMRQERVTNQTKQKTPQHTRSDHRFSMPQINGDLNRQYNYSPVVMIHHHRQYVSNSQNQFTFSDSVVKYDQARKQCHTELV